jgi:putative Mn2+ efflux pump MntP
MKQKLHSKPMNANKLDLRVTIVIGIRTTFNNFALGVG